MKKYKKSIISVTFIFVIAIVVAVMSSINENKRVNAAGVEPEFSLTVANSWESNGDKFYQFDGTISNVTSSRIKNWSVEFNMDSSAKVETSWSMEYTLKNGKITIIGVDYNSVIEVNGKATFGMIVKNPGEFDVNSVELIIDGESINNSIEPVETQQTAIVKPTQTQTTQAPTQAVSTAIIEPTVASVENNRYYPESMSASEIKAAAAELPKSEVKAIIYKEVDEHWDVISKYFNQTDKQKVYALFLGLATRESTLNAGLETAYEAGFGVNPAHAFGCFQTAVTAYQGCNPTFDQEDDVDEMYWYTLTEKNFYDPYISTHMGIRKLIHFIKEAESQGLTDIEIVRGALKGFNTGHADYINDTGYYAGYVDEIAALGGWYYANDHYNDEVFTWTGDTRVNRNDPWGWWK